MARQIGVTLGTQTLTGVDGLGVTWRTFTPISGWAGSPASTLALSQKLRAPGAWVGTRELTPRILSLSGSCSAPSGLGTDRSDLLRMAEDALTAAVSLDETTVYVTEGSLTRFCNVYRQDEVLVEWDHDSYFRWSIQLAAADPRKYAANLSATTGLPSTSGGLVVPFTLPTTISGVVTSGQVTLTSPGNTTGPVVLRIDGPVTGPIVTHVSSGLQLTFASSLVIPNGQYLLIDMEAQTVLAQGQSSRNGYVTSRGWSGFDAGPNTWSFAAVSGSGQLTVTASPAWL